VTLTLPFDRVILHTIVYHSLTSTYMPNFIEIEETFCGTDKHMDGRTFETLFIMSTQSRPKNDGTDGWIDARPLLRILLDVASIIKSKAPALEMDTSVSYYETINLCFTMLEFCKAFSRSRC